MFCIFSMFSAFSMFFMVSHPGWQDGTICGALLDIKRDIHAETSGKIIFKISKRIFTQRLCGKEYSCCSSYPQMTNSAARGRFGWTEGRSEELLQGCPGYSETVYSLIRRTMVNTKNNPDARELLWQLWFYGIFQPSFSNNSWLFFQSTCFCYKWLHMAGPWRMQ